MGKEAEAEVGEEAWAVRWVESTEDKLAVTAATVAVAGSVHWAAAVGGEDRAAAAWQVAQVRAARAPNRLACHPACTCACPRCMCTV